MIVIDTSALLAILLNEAEGPACLRVIENAQELTISAGTMAEALIVGGHRKQADDLLALLRIADVMVVPVTAGTAQQCAEAHLLWGKGVHPASLNFGDCFAYALAKSRDCPLLYVGNDFAQTDIVSAL